MSRTDNKKYFDERFDRLKSALGVRSDSKLADELGCAAQSVGGAKKRSQMPVSWLEEAGKKGISLNYIFYGEHEAL